MGGNQSIMNDQKNNTSSILDRQNCPETKYNDDTSKILDYGNVLGKPEDHNVRRSNAHGYWIGEDTSKLHSSFFDGNFASALPAFFLEENAKSVIDVGAGDGRISESIGDVGIFTSCYDGNPNTQEISNGRCAMLDFSKIVNFPIKYDWVIAIKVGKHIPKAHEETFIQNLHKLNKYGIIINWGGSPSATPDTPKDASYFNHRSDEYLIDRFTKLGYENDVIAQEQLRKVSSNNTLRSRLLVFRKKRS